jgi:radical SAM protein (TIGR01212 family)
MAEEEKHIFPWGNGRRFNSYPEYFRRIYGSRIQKVSVDAGFTCPNRDGTRGYGGCTFCNNDAFNPSYCMPEKPVLQQISEGIEFLSHRYKTRSFLAYFQAFSNTYAPVERLRELYEQALNMPGIKGLIIGTRPDCIDRDKLDYLKELSGKYYIAVEYGIESCYDKTLKRINRGHTFAEAREALNKTAAMGIHTGAHFIFGLPGESRDEMLAEAGIISSLPLTTVKFHQLQIIKGTRMHREYIQHPEDFNLFSLEEYIDFFVKFLERLNPSIVVERFTGEAPPRLLAGQGWGKKRTDQLIGMIEMRMEELQTWQGKLFSQDNQLKNCNGIFS